MIFYVQALKNQMECEDLLFYSVFFLSFFFFYVCRATVSYLLTSNSPFHVILAPHNILTVFWNASVRALPSYGTSGFKVPSFLCSHLPVLLNSSLHSPTRIGSAHHPLVSLPLYCSLQLVCFCLKNSRCCEGREHLPRCLAVLVPNLESRLKVGTH